MIENERTECGEATNYNIFPDSVMNRIRYSEYRLLPKSVQLKIDALILEYGNVLPENELYNILRQEFKKVNMQELFRIALREVLKDV